MNGTLKEKLTATLLFQQQ